MVRVVQFEGYAFDEISQVVGASDSIRIRVGCCATYGDGPPMGVGVGSPFSLLWGENTGCVSIDNRTVNA